MLECNYIVPKGKQLNYKENQYGSENR